MKNVIYRPTWAEVDLAALVYNLAQVRRIVGPGVKVMVTVKADAYGHGIIAVSKKLEQSGVDYLGVASIEEAIILRKNKIRTPILILGMIFPHQVKPILEYNLTATVCTKEVARALSKEAARRRKIVRIHIKIDTGMSRLGVWFNKAADFVLEISKIPRLKIEWIYTHFPLADTDANFTQRQIELFKQIQDKLKDKIHIPLMHAANSMGILGYKDSHFNLVRPGLMIYGLYPRLNLKVKLKQGMGLKSKIVYLKKVPPLLGISYGHTYITRRPTTVAVLPIGYGDGYPRILSNKADVLIGGKRHRIVGMICMDQMMVDVSAIKNPKIGQEVILIGRQKTEEITATELAGISQTISYEIVCGIGARVPRIYKA